MKSLSGWPDVSIQRFWKASAMRRTRKPLPHGRQSRPAVRQKKSRTFPTGNALPSIDAFFKLGASFGAHPFSFIVKMERIRLSELSISGNVLGEALSERCPDSASRIKPKIRTLLLSRKGSDFHCLVRPGGFEPLAFRVGAERSIQLSYDRTICTDESVQYSIAQLLAKCK